MPGNKKGNETPKRPKASISDHGHFSYRCQRLDYPPAGARGSGGPLTIPIGITPARSPSFTAVSHPNRAKSWDR